MRNLEAQVNGERIVPGPQWRCTWLDRSAGLARLTDGRRVFLAVVEGSGSRWVVTLGGRRVPVDVSTDRERMLAAAGAGTGTPGGAVAVKATLPGLVVAVGVAVGAEVAAGGSLLTIEAMKMQNEVRAPRAGRVAEVHVKVGARIGAGDPLVLIE